MKESEFFSYVRFLVWGPITKTSFDEIWQFSTYFELSGAWRSTDPRVRCARSCTNGEGEVRSLRKFDQRFCMVLRMAISVRNPRKFLKIVWNLFISICFLLKKVVVIVRDDSTKTIPDEKKGFLNSQVPDKTSNPQPAILAKTLSERSVFNIITIN